MATQQDGQQKVDSTRSKTAQIWFHWQGKKRIEIQAFLDSRVLDFRNFRFSAVYDSINFFFYLSKQKNSAGVQDLNLDYNTFAYTS